MDHNPAFYQLSSKYGSTTSKGLERYAAKMAEAKGTARVAPEMVPHPLYVELQKRSPMGMMKDYTIREFDDALSPINAVTFYQDFVS